VIKARLAKSPLGFSMSAPTDLSGRPAAGSQLDDGQGGDPLFPAVKYPAQALRFRLGQLCRRSHCCDHMRRNALRPIAAATGELAEACRDVDCIDSHEVIDTNAETV
jgi:hypothetical protein